MSRFSPELYEHELLYKVKALLRIAEEEMGSVNSVQNSDFRLLDFGCHDGKIVYALRNEGFNCFGFDIKEGKSISIADTENVKYVWFNNYRIPYPDNYFDIIYSHHVFEHVQNYDESLKELHRVLKPNGCMIHLFPSRWRVLESHFYIPFGGAFHPVWWCFFGEH